MMSEKLTIKEVGNKLGADENTAVQENLDIEDDILQELWDEARYKFNDYNDALDDLWEYIYANDTSN